MSELRSGAQRRCVTSRDAVVSGAARVPTGSLLSTAVTLALAVVAASLLPLVFGVAVVVLAVVVLVATQRSATADLMAGVTLLVAQPYDPGEKIRVYLDDAGEVIDAEVLQVRLLRTTLCTGNGMFAVRNSHMLRDLPVRTAA